MLKYVKVYLEWIKCGNTEEASIVVSYNLLPQLTLTFCSHL